MARIDTLREIYAKKMLIKDFDFDGLFHVPISYYLTPEDISRLHYLATSAKYASKTKKEKFEMVDMVMIPRGFKRFSSGTNRIVYRNEYDQSFLLKIAIDQVAINDSLDEMYNQRFVKPFVTKVFDVSPCGTVGMVERVNPIANRHEFEDIAYTIFDILQNFFIGKYILEDIGTDFFTNWGIRDGFGPVLLDFPYLYETDGDKLQCAIILPNGQRCDGMIDYDSGLNTLVCEKCGKRYSAKSLSKANHIKPVRAKIIEEEYNMEKEIMVSVIKDGKEYKIHNEADFVTPRTSKPKRGKEEDLVASVTGGYNEKTENKSDARKAAEEVINNAKQLAQETGEVIVTAKQTVLSAGVPLPDEEGFIEVPKPSFKSSNKNSELKFQDPKIEENFVAEAKHEQQELQQKETKAKTKSRVTAKERIQINDFIANQMKEFPFESYTDPTQHQRSDMIDYLIAAVSSKYSLTPDILVMVVSEYVDNNYTFTDADDVAVKVEAVTDDIAKAEALAAEYYGADGYDADHSTVEPITKRNGISKEF